MTLGRLRSGHHSKLKYWLAKSNRAVDIICWKYGLGDETAEHAIYKCFRMHRPPAEPPLCNTMERNLKLVLMIWEKWKSMSDLSNILQPQPLHTNSLLLIAQQSSSSSFCILFHASMGWTGFDNRFSPHSSVLGKLRFEFHFSKVFVY